MASTSSASDAAGQRHQPEPDQARRAVLAAQHGIAAAAQRQRLRAQQHDGQQQQRQRGGGGELGLGRELEQAPDLGGERMEAGRNGEDRGRAEQVQRLQEGDQRAGQQGRQRKRHGDAPRGLPGPRAQHRRGVLELARHAVERVGDQDEDVGKGVAGDDEDQAWQRVDVEQRLVGRHAGERAPELVQQAGVGRGQHLPGDRRRRTAASPARPSPGCAPCGGAACRCAPPASRAARRPRSRSRSPRTAMMRVVISGSTKVGSVNRATKLPSVAWPVLGPKAVDHQPAHRQHDHDRQQRGDGDQHGAREVRQAPRDKGPSRRSG